MAAEQLSTAIKEEWSLTEEQVALIEASTALSDKPDDVETRSCGSAPNNSTITIFVPTPTLLGRAHKTVADWGIKPPSNGELRGAAIGPGCNALQILRGLLELIRVLKAKEGLGSTTDRLQRLVAGFLTERLRNPRDDAHEIWDIISLNKRVLHLGKGGAPTVPSNNVYGHIQLALSYNAPRRSFACVYSYVYRLRDGLTDAFETSGTPQRANSIRILYANLMANSIKANLPQLVNLVPSDQPYPPL